MLNWGWKGRKQTCDLGCFIICLLFCWNFQCAKFQVKFSNLRLVKLSIAEHHILVHAKYHWSLRKISNHKWKYSSTVQIFTQPHLQLHFSEKHGCLLQSIFEFWIISLSHRKDFYMVQLRCMGFQAKLFFVLLQYFARIFADLF